MVVGASEQFRCVVPQIMVKYTGRKEVKNEKNITFINGFITLVGNGRFCAFVV